MNQTLTIARREVSSLFYSPIAYVVLGLVALGATLIFLIGFQTGYEATMRPTMVGMVWLTVFLAPAISMRLLSEELRSGTIEPLMTSPVTDAQVIVGKWLGALAFFAATLLPMGVLVLVLEAHANPQWGPILAGTLGLLLVGGFYLAIGAFASAATQNQIIAFLLAVFLILVFTLVTWFLGGAAFLPTWARQAMFRINVNQQFDAFARGVIDSANITFFASGTVLFLFFAAKLLESKRWR